MCEILKIISQLWLKQYIHSLLLSNCNILCNLSKIILINYGSSIQLPTNRFSHISSIAISFPDSGASCPEQNYEQNYERSEILYKQFPHVHYKPQKSSYSIPLYLCLHDSTSAASATCILPRYSSDSFCRSTNMCTLYA